VVFVGWFHAGSLPQQIRICWKLVWEDCAGLILPAILPVHQEADFSLLKDNSFSLVLPRMFTDSIWHRTDELFIILRK